MTLAVLYKTNFLALKNSCRGYINDTWMLELSHTGQLINIKLTFEQNLYFITADYPGYSFKLCSKLFKYIKIVDIQNI